MVSLNSNATGKKCRINVTITLWNERVHLFLLDLMNWQTQNKPHNVVLYCSKGIPQEQGSIVLQQINIHPCLDQLCLQKMSGIIQLIFSLMPHQPRRKHCFLILQGIPIIFCLLFEELQMDIRGHTILDIESQALIHYFQSFDDAFFSHCSYKANSIDSLDTQT